MSAIGQRKPIRQTSFIVLSLLFATSVYGWDNNVVHPEITKAAVDFIDVQEISDYTWRPNAGIPDQQCSYVDEGSVKEDHIANPPINFMFNWGGSTCGISVGSVRNHGYNPKTGEGWWSLDLISEPAVSYGQLIWDQAKDYYLQGDKENAYFSLGRLCHLLEDMSSPAHTQTDFHGFGDDLEHLGEEIYSPSMFSLHNIRKPSTHGYSSSETGDLTQDSFENFMKNLAWVTYYASTFYGGELPRGSLNWPDSELKRMFPGFCYVLAPTSPNYWEIPGVGRYYDLENWQGGDSWNNDWWECPNDPGYYYIENLNGPDGSSWIAPAYYRKDFFRRTLDSDDLNSMLMPNNQHLSLAVLYLSNLLPVASEWVAGLLQFFYYEVNPVPNHAPTLYNPQVGPPSGTTVTDFEFTIHYYDPDGDPPDPIYRKVYISGTGGQAEGIMSLKSGSAAKGTYSYTRTLPQGSYSYLFFFADEHGLSDITNGYGGPYVYSDSDAVINIVIQCTRISSDLRLRYSLTGSSPWTDIPITKQILDPLAVPAGSTVWFQADVASANYEYREWELLENGSRIGGGTGSLWWFTLGTNTSEVGLNVFYRYTPQYYTISGTVLKGDGTPVPVGVDLILTSDEQTMSQHTDNGNWSFSGVQGGVSVTITPSASGYVFSPANLVYNNLKDNYTNQQITAYAADDYAPMTSFLTIPPAVSENSSVSFSWTGSDNKSSPSSLQYQYKLDGVDADWSTWSSATSKGYDVENGAYIFWVRAQDEAGNINQAPINYKFVVNAASKVIAAERINNSVWASRITLQMPVGASHPTDKFVLLLSHSGINDPELIPVQIHQANQTTPCGANSIVASQLGLTARIEKTESGWLVTLPQSISSGQSAQYDIVWGKIKYFGWQEFQPIPLNFPNVGQKYPPNYNDLSQVDSSYLDGSLKLWRTAVKKIKFGTYCGEANASILMNISNKNGPVVGETLLRYTPGTGWDGSYGRYTLYIGTHIVPVGSNMALLWRDEQEEYFKATYTDVKKWRHGAETFNYSGSVIGSHDGTYAEHRSVYIPTRSIGDTLWFVDADETTAAFWVLNSDCSEIITKTTFESFTANDSDLSLESAVQIGNNVLFLWTRYWYTLSHDRRREQIMYQIRDLSGNIVKATVELSPALLNDDIDKDDKYSICSILPDKNGKVWIAYNHIQSGQSTEFSYLIIGADGNIWKGPIQTTGTRNFNFCDKNGYIWATEGGQFFALNPNDTIAFGPRTSAFIPNQSVGNIAASVAADGYRIYDRWSPQPVSIDVPQGGRPDSIELFDLNLWENNLHPANLTLKKGDTVVWSQSGQFIGHTTIDVSSILSEGQNLLIMTQDDFLGGQVLVTFPYQLQLPPPSKPVNPSPSNGATNQSINVDISWSNGGGATNYDVYFGTNATPDSGEYKGNQAGTSYDPGTLAYSTTYYWCIDANNTSGITPGDVWSFTTAPPPPPGAASSPVPANAATNVSLTQDLSWTAGSGATSHDVYFGTSSPGTFRGNQPGTTYDTGTMSNNTPYYWRIDEKNAGGTTTGTVWSFTTAPPSQVATPNVVGMTQSAAETTITGAGLIVGTVTQQYSNTVAVGLVVSENPVGGTAVNIGSSVNLVISLGNPGPPTLSISAVDNQAAETVSGAPANTGTFTISRTGSTANALTVYFTRGGTATFGATGDYTLSTILATSVVIPIGQPSVDITVTPVDNSLPNQMRRLF